MFQARHIIRNLYFRRCICIYPAMQNVATVITDPARADLDEESVEAVAEMLTEAGAGIEEIYWLDEAIACDLVFTGPLVAATRNLFKEAFSASAFDIVVQPRQGRRKDLLVADMDSTIIEGETLDELADHAGLKEAVAAITDRAMNGELDFKQALRERVALLKGLPVGALEETVERMLLNPGANELIRTMRAHGAFAVLVSGGFKFISARIAEETGFNADQANRLEIVDGQLTGRVIEPILDRDAKLAALERYARERNVPLSETLAVGDGANDAPMIEAAGMGVAYHAKPVLRNCAAATIDNGDLTALLYLQGYAGDEFER